MNSRASFSASADSRKAPGGTYRSIGLGTSLIEKPISDEIITRRGLLHLTGQNRGSRRSPGTLPPRPSRQKAKPSAQIYSARQLLLPAASVEIPCEPRMQIGMTLASLSPALTGSGPASLRTGPRGATSFDAAAPEPPPASVH